MREGISRRQLFGAALAALLGSWARGLLAPLGRSAAATPTPSPAELFAQRRSAARICDPVGSVTTYTYDATGRLLAVSPRGSVTTFTYNLASRPVPEDPTPPPVEPGQARFGGGDAGPSPPAVGPHTRCAPGA